MHSHSLQRARLQQQKPKPISSREPNGTRVRDLLCAHVGCGPVGGVVTEASGLEWNYNRIYHKVSSYVLEGEPVRAVLLFDALAKREGRDVQTGLLAQEWHWLQWNLGFMKRVATHKLLATMMFLTHKSGWASFTVRELARRSGYNEGLVCRYARQLEAKNLLRRHHIKYDRKVYYVASTDLPTISKMLMELILVKHGLDSFENFLKPSEEKRMKHARFLRDVNQRVKHHHRLKGRS